MDLEWGPHLWGMVEEPTALLSTQLPWAWALATALHGPSPGAFPHLALRKSFPTPVCADGFRKVVHIEQGGLVKPERDDTEFQHPCFLRGQEQLLENIKRKVTSVSTLKSEDIKIRQDSVTKLLTDVQLMKGKQECMDSKLLAMKHENEALWREVASLRQKHAQQQKVVNKLIQFLISLVQSNRILGVKRKIPLMLSDSSSAHSVPKYGRQYSLEHVHGPGPYSAPSPAYSSSSLYTPDVVTSSGPIISDITELAPASPLASPGRSIDERPLSSSPLVRVKEEPPSPPRTPRVEEASPRHPSSVDTPLSPTALIDSILRESEPGEPAPTSATAPTDAGGRVPSSPPRSAPEKCLSVACLDKNELSDHLDAMDSNLDNLQTMLTSHGFSVDTSALLDIQELLSPPEPPRPLEAENNGPDSGEPSPVPAPHPPTTHMALTPTHPQGSSWCSTQHSLCSCWTRTPWTRGAVNYLCSLSWGRAPTSPRETTTQMIPPFPC
uniref:Heat shock transcription factor 1 n=1 Tax=Spermophilus dauricus TaxID=99837 RepID=A0A8C9UQC0_SPEDA